MVIFLLCIHYTWSWTLHNYALCESCLRFNSVDHKCEDQHYGHPKCNPKLKSESSTNQEHVQLHVSIGCRCFSFVCTYAESKRKPKQTMITTQQKRTKRFWGRRTCCHLYWYESQAENKSPPPPPPPPGPHPHPSKKKKEKKKTKVLRIFEVWGLLTVFAPWVFFLTINKRVKLAQTVQYGWHAVHQTQLGKLEDSVKSHGCANT